MRNHELREVETVSEKLELDDNAHVVEELIGPDEALELLRYNTMNRNLSPHTVARYASDMQTGAWGFVGDPIRIFDAEGGGFVLIDGQHRLQAIVESKTRHRFLVVYLSGTQEQMLAAIRKLDKHRKRTLSDDITITREEYGVPKSTSPTTVAAAITALAVADILVPSGIYAFNVYTVPARQEYARRHPEDIQAAVGMIGAWRSKNKRLPLNGYVAAYIVIARVNPTMGAAFWERVASGAMLAETDPIFLLREHVLKGTHIFPSSFATTEKYMKPYNLLLHAWNLHCEGAQRAYMRVNKSAFITPLRHPDESYTALAAINPLRSQRRV